MARRVRLFLSPGRLPRVLAAGRRGQRQQLVIAEILDAGNLADSGMDTRQAGVDVGRGLLGDTGGLTHKSEFRLRLAGRLRLLQNAVIVSTSTATLYLRVSTSDQNTHTQYSQLWAAARSGWTIVAVYEDAGISGAKGRNKRPGFDQLLCSAIEQQAEPGGMVQPGGHGIGDQLGEGGGALQGTVAKIA